MGLLEVQLRQVMATRDQGLHTMVEVDMATHLMGTKVIKARGMEQDIRGREATKAEDILRVARGTAVMEVSMDHLIGKVHIDRKSKDVFA